MHLQITADVVEGDERGQRLSLSRLDLAAVLAQLRRHPHQVHRFEDVLLRLAADPSPLLRFPFASRFPDGHAKNSVLVDAQSALDPHFTYRQVMGFGPREVVERRPVRAPWDDAQVHLQAGAQDNCAARRAGRFHLLDLSERQEVLHDGPGVFAGGEDVDVPHGLLPAPVAASHFQVFDPRCLAEMREQGLDELLRVGERKTPGVPFEVFDGAAEIGGSLFTEARELFDAPGLECLGELAYRSNSQRVIELPGPLGAEGFQPHQVGHGRGVFAVQPFECRQRPRP
jgi:hypothetical protein